MHALPCGIGCAGEFVNTVGNNSGNEISFGKKVPVKGSHCHSRCGSYLTHADIGAIFSDLLARDFHDGDAVARRIGAGLSWWCHS